jgi:cyclic-di-AMP phosphodiesterase PgpH
MAPDSKGDGGRGALGSGPGPSRPEPPEGRPEPRLDARRITEVVPPRWLSRASNALVLALLALACAYLLTPGLFSQRIPFGEESLNTFSTTVVKATRDYDIPDEETTRRKREEARDAILPVYDYDVTVAESAGERLRSAFALMQEAAREVELAQRAAPPPPEPKVEEAAKGRGAKKAEPPPPPPAPDPYGPAFAQRREELERRLETHLDDESLRAFAAARFSEEAEREAERLMIRANGQMVAEYRDPLALKAGRGIVVRRRSGGETLSEKVVLDVTPIRDQSEIHAELERGGADLPPELAPALRRALATLAARELRANLRYNREETEERKRLAAETVKPVVIQLKKGEKIIGDGERIEHRHLVIFAALKSQAGEEGSLSARAGGGLYAALVSLVVYGFARVSMRRFRPTRKDALLGALTVIVMIGLSNLSVTVSDALHDRFPRLPNEVLYYATPFAAGAMLIRFVLTSEAAVVYSMVFASLAGVLVGNSLEFATYALVGSLVAAARVSRAKDRAQLFRAGVFTGLVNAAAVLCLGLLDNKLTAVGAAAGCLGAFLGGALAVPILVMGITPLVEAAFGYTTDIKLLELANLNHPALKELIVQAPGTYHHSIIIGSLVEAAAEAIGANPLLARVCAYYHDIGKGRNPLYFSENQRGENRHDKLAPQMSALVIKRHVTDGIEMARQYKLPKQVADAIPQHHGTRLVGYFFHKALKEQEAKPDAPPVDDALYRYPGPKPQFREAALVMIADAVEASSRAMQDPTPSKLQALVQKIINGIFADGQLDECDLTLRDLNEIARSFFRILGGIYHSRPDYPSQAAAGRPALAEVKAGEPPSPDAPSDKRVLGDR